LRAPTLAARVALAWCSLRTIAVIGERAATPHSAPLARSTHHLCARVARADGSRQWSGLSCASLCGRRAAFAPVFLARALQLAGIRRRARRTYVAAQRASLLGIPSQLAARNGASAIALDRPLFRVETDSRGCAAVREPVALAGCAGHPPGLARLSRQHAFASRSDGGRPRTLAPLAQVGVI